MDEVMNQAVDQRLLAEGGLDMTDVSSELTGSEIHDLQMRLRQRIAACEAMAASAPVVQLVRRVAAGDQFGETGVAVDVGIGAGVLCLFVPDRLTSKMGGPSLSDLAELIFQRVHEVHRARQRHTDRFVQARRMIDAAIERSAAGMTLVSLKTAPQRVDANLTGRHLQLEANVSMLNDALRPYTQRIVDWTPRGLVSGISCHASEQRKRRRALAKMAGSAAVLKIDILAERAISLAGANLAACATSLLEGCDLLEGGGQEIILNENGESRTSIYLRSGRIMASVRLVDVGLIAGHTFIVNRPFPETVTDALAGQTATTIVDHPVLQNIRITSAQRDGMQTFVRLKMPKRFIRPAELDEVAQSTV
ncbi:hypothetical protein DMC47_18450 [Nostoc sp. 3335mG]|nr:hypothetical protein DMC47_18450 [Nostoc sp. 3335mG]